jgi:hypothetical protein
VLHFRDPVKSNQWQRLDSEITTAVAQHDAKFSIAGDGAIKFRQRSDTHQLTISYLPAQFYLAAFQDHSDLELKEFLQEYSIRQHHDQQPKPARAIFHIIDNDPQVQLVLREDAPYMYNNAQAVHIHKFPLFKAYPQFTQVSVCFIDTTNISEWDVSRFEALRPAFTTAGQAEPREDIDMGWLESEIDDMIAMERKAVEDLEDAHVVKSE